MNSLYFQKLFLVCCVVSALFFARPGQAAANWINSSSGFWKDGTNWSIGRAPDAASGGTLITNANSKTVTLDAQTPATNLTINSLTLSGSNITTNTVQLSNVGTNRPLTLINSSELKITQGGALVITNSSLVITGSFGQGFNLFAGRATLESGSIRIVEDPGVVDTTVFVRVGRTNAASVTINGGVMEAGTMLLADAPFAQFGAQGTVRINGGLLSLSGELSVGTGIRGTGLVEVLGGRLQVANHLTNVTRIGDAGFGEMSVSGGAVFLGGTSVARHDGARGTLTVRTNGFIQFSDDLSIGRFSGATGTVVVAGGQLDVIDHPIWIGREGAGHLIISNGVVSALSLNIAALATNTAFGSLDVLGGSTILSSNLVVGSQSNSTAQMSVVAGEIAITNSSASGNVDLLRGTLGLRGGTVTADFFRMTNSAGRFVFSSGALRTKGTVASNGLPFIVGDGTNRATLELVGGIHQFANGLVISSNATLIGCGTIIGSVVNQGTIATNCGSISTGPTITQQPMSLTVTQGATATFTVMASGDPPLTYQWRFSGLMGNIPGATTTTLAVTNAQLSDAGNYRVSVSNPSGTTNSDIATLRVLVSPAIENATLLGGSDFTFAFNTVAGLTYKIEYKNSLNDPAWVLFRTQPGDGTKFTVTENITLAPSRFFRIRVE